MSSLRPLLLYILTSTIVSTHALPSNINTTQTPSTCNFLESLFSSYLIRSEPTLRNQTYAIGPSCYGSLYCLQTLDPFHVSQDAAGANKHDLVASFRIEDHPIDASCAEFEAHRLPYVLEFFYQPGDPYSVMGGHRRIDVFDIKGNLPQKFDGHREYYDIPNWDNIGPLTGPLVGTFQLPSPGRKTQLLLPIAASGSRVCRAQYNFRLSFPPSDKGAGFVDYIQLNTTGLRMRFGC